MTTTIPGLVPVEAFPRFVPLSALEAVQRERAQALHRVEILTEQLTALRASQPSQADDRATIARLRGERDALDAECVKLRRQLLEARQQPLVAVVDDQPCAECAKLRQRLDAVRELLKRHAPKPA